MVFNLELIKFFFYVDFNPNVNSKNSAPVIMALSISNSVK